MDLSVIIVNKNTRAMLKDCLCSLGQGNNTPRTEVWVVDNASNDGSVQMVQNEFPTVKLIVNQENTGFAHANNQALVQAMGHYCLLLNPDTIVPAGTLDSMVRFMENTPNAGVVGCAQVYPDGRRQITCHRGITLIREACVALGVGRVFRSIIDYGAHALDAAGPHQVDWVEGGALLIRRSVLATIGLMDENFFMYAEDADLCLRVWKADMSVYYMPDVQIIHYRGQSTGFEQRERQQPRISEKMLITLHQSKTYFIRKHYGAWQGKVYQLLARVYSLRKLCLWLVFYVLRMTRRETWSSFSKAYLGLLKADLDYEE